MSTWFEENVFNATGLWGMPGWSLIAVVSVLMIALAVFPLLTRKRLKHSWVWLVATAVVFGATLGVLRYFELWPPAAIDDDRLAAVLVERCTVGELTAQEVDGCMAAARDAAADLAEAADSRLRRAGAAMADGGFEEAEHLLRAVAEADADGGDGDRRVAVAHATLGALNHAADPEGAIEFYDRAGRLDPMEPSFAVHLARLYERIGDEDEAYRRLSHVAELPYTEDDREAMVWRSAALHSLGNLARRFGSMGSAGSWYEQALAADETLGNKEGQAVNLLRLGKITADFGDPADGVDQLERALALYEELGDKDGQSAVLVELGWVALAAGDLAAAASSNMRALTLKEGLGDPEGQAGILSTLGTIARMRDDLDAAYDYYGRALALNVEAGRKGPQASNLEQLGKIAELQSNLDVAEDHYNRALAINVERGRRWDQAKNLFSLGTVARARSDLQTAAGYYERVLVIVEAAESTKQQAVILGFLGNIAAVRGELAAAHDFHERALHFYQALSGDVGPAVSLGNLGHVAMRRGDLTAAEDFQMRALAHSEAAGSAVGQAINLFNLGLLDELRGSRVDACGDYRQATERLLAAGLSAEDNWAQRRFQSRCERSAGLSDGSAPAQAADMSVAEIDAPDCSVMTELEGSRTLVALLPDAACFR